MATKSTSVFETAFEELNACQIAILRLMQSGQKFIGTMMPRQVGKTHFGVWCIREFMRQNSNCQTMFLAKDFPSIKRNTQEKFMKLFPDDEFNITTQGVSHPNPSQMQQRGSCFLSGVDKNPHKIRGGTMAFVHWSEVAFSKFEGGQSFQTIHETVVLPTVSRTLGYYYMESTPFGSNFWKTWWEANNGFAKIKFTLELCVALGAITEEQVEFMRKTMHPDVFRQEMECMFVSFMGKLYSEYDASRHNDRCDIAPHEKVILGIDIGHTAAFSVLFGVWRQGTLYIFDQIYQKGLRIGQMVDLVEQRLAYHKVPREQYTAYSDHDPEMMQELTSRKIKVNYADKTDPFACRMSIKEGLYFETIKINPVKCQKLINELDAATWDEKKADEMDMRGDPNEAHWDSEASLRYLYRGSKVELEKPEEEPEEVKNDTASHAEWRARKTRRELKNIKEKASEETGLPKGVFEY